MLDNSTVSFQGEAAHCAEMSCARKCLMRPLKLAPGNQSPTTHNSSNVLLQLAGVLSLGEHF